MMLATSGYVGEVGIRLSSFTPYLVFSGKPASLASGDAG